MCFYRLWSKGKWQHGWPPKFFVFRQNFFLNVKSVVDIFFKS